MVIWLLKYYLRGLCHLETLSSPRDTLREKLDITKVTISLYLIESIAC